MILNLIKSAIQLLYDNSKSGLSATNTQDAIDEVQENVSKLQSALITSNVSFTISSTSGNGAFSGNVSIAKAGYTAIGVIGWYSGQSHFSVADLYVNGNTLNYRLKNVDSASHNGTFTAIVLYRLN